MESINDIQFQANTPFEMANAATFSHNSFNVIASKFALRAYKHRNKKIYKSIRHSLLSPNLR